MSFRPRILYDFQGEKLTLEEIAIKTQIPVIDLLNRRHGSRDIAEVIRRIQVAGGLVKDYHYQGQDYSLKELFVHPDKHPTVDTHSLRNRIKQSNWPIEKALKTPVVARTTARATTRYPYLGQRLTVREILIQSQVPIKYDALKAAIDQNYPFKTIEAIVESRKKHPRNRYAVILDGETRMIARREVFNLPRNPQVDDTLLSSRLKKHQQDPEHYKLDWCLNAAPETPPY